MILDFLNNMSAIGLQAFNDALEGVRWAFGISLCCFPFIFLFFFVSFFVSKK